MTAAVADPTVARVTLVTPAEDRESFLRNSATNRSGRFFVGASVLRRATVCWIGGRAEISARNNRLGSDRAAEPTFAVA